MPSDTSPSNVKKIVADQRLVSSSISSSVREKFFPEQTPNSKDAEEIYEHKAVDD